MALFNNSIEKWKAKGNEVPEVKGSLFERSITKYSEKRAAEKNMEEGKRLLRNATPTLTRVRAATIDSMAPEDETEALKKIDQEADLGIQFREGGEISEGEKTATQKTVDLLPRSLREGLFGITGEQGDRGLVGFATGLKTDTQKVNDRVDALKELGVDDERAYQLALQDVRSRSLIDSINVIGGGVNATNITKEERKALASAGRWEAVDTLFFGLDIATLGGSKGVRTIIREGAETTVKNIKRITQADEAVDVILKNIDNTKIPKTTRAKWYRNLRNSLDDGWTTIREAVEDDWVRVKKLMKEPGVVVEEGADPYTAEVLMAGRIGSRVEESRAVGQAVVDDIANTASKLEIAPDDLTTTVNQYLKALHAGERIREIGENAMDITRTQADEILQTIRNSELYDDVKRISDEVKKMHDETLDILREGQVITDDLYNTLRSKYKNHVPLQRILDDVDDVGSILVRRGTDVTSTGIKKAKGSTREVSDILENVVYNREQAILRAEKNRVALNIDRFAENNKQLGIFKKMKRKMLGDGLDGSPIFEMVTDPQVLQYYKNGKKAMLRIEDQKLATVFRGIGREKWPAMLKFIPAFTRFYSGLATRFNPEFALSNKIRDIQEAVIYAAANGQGARATRVAVRDPKSMKTVTDYIRGVDSTDTQLYRQMIEDGGTTGGYALSSRADITMDFEKMRKLSRSNGRRAATKILEYVDNWNRVFEDSSRLSVYKEALAQGMSRTRAARMAKESTINFNKMGTYGPIVNGLYMFSNASIQGSAKMLRSLRDPKVAGAVVSTVGASVWATNEWNSKVDPEWRDKVTEWDRMNSLVVMLPSEDGDSNYFVIPVSWGIKPLKVAADALYDVADGFEADIAGAVGKIVASLFEGYNPIGGSDFGQMITPTIGDIPIDVYRNNAWYGGKIAPDWDQYAPDSTRYFPDLKDTISGRTIIAVTKGLSGLGIEVSPANIDYVYNQLIGGAGRTTNKVVDTISAIGSEEEVDVKNIPFVSRFLRSRPENQIGAGTTKGEYLNELLGEQSRDRFYLGEEAEEIHQTFKASPNGAQLFSELAQKDPEMAQMVKQVAHEEELGLNYTERRILKLGVDNWSRARFIHQELKEAETDEQRDQIWNDYVKKKIITKKVSDQLKYLISNN